MFKFNANHIMTGQIKQILNAFNLPSFKIYTAQHYKYFLDHGVESPELSDGLYIKWDRVWSYKNGKWEKALFNYAFNNKYTNYTRTLPIVNNIYDSDTHEYLGEFLRFQRDYLGVDLMPLYNCFSNRVCSNINISITQKVLGTREKRDEHGNIIYRKFPNLDQFSNVPEIEPYVAGERILKRQFYSQDKNFVIYTIPIKFFKEYTIALDCGSGAEICCGFYNDYLQELPDRMLLNTNQARIPPVAMSQYISNVTYKKYNGLAFNTPIVWQGIQWDSFKEILDNCTSAGLASVQGVFTGEDYKQPKKEVLERTYKKRLLAQECDLRLFLKIPVHSKTSIVVLEGDYHDYNNAKYTPEKIYITQAITYDEIINGKKVKQKRNIITTQQTRWIKKLNHSVTNYETKLYAGNKDPKTGFMKITTTELPEVEDRPFKPISPLQLLMFNTKESYPFSDRLIEYLSGNVITEWDENADNIRRAQKVMELNNNKFAINGAWEGKMRNILYDYMMSGNSSNSSFGIDAVHDILGYVDKDVEKIYTAWLFEDCRDQNGELIPLTMRLPVRDPETGEIVYDENGNIKYEEQKVYKLVKKLLESATIDKTAAQISTHSLLTEEEEFLLTVQDEGEIPLFKQKYIPIGNIQNIDIYQEED